MNDEIFNENKLIMKKKISYTLSIILLDLFNFFIE